MMVCIMAATLWSNDVKNQQTTVYLLSPYPQNQMLFYESSLCSSSNIPMIPPSNNNIRCPQKPIVTVEQLGRLGNQMYEYISVWATAKKTGHEPYVPSCLIQELEKIFQNITVPPLSYLAYCNIEKFPVQVNAEELDHFSGSILLPTYAQLPKYIAPLLSEIQQIFQFKQEIIEVS